jgi:hypothetical protein
MITYFRKSPVPAPYCDKGRTVSGAGLPHKRTTRNVDHPDPARQPSQLAARHAHRSRLRIFKLHNRFYSETIPETPSMPVGVSIAPYVVAVII